MPSRCDELVNIMEEDGERGPEEGYLLVRVHVPELNVQKCLQFPRDQLVWNVKQQCLAALPKVSRTCPTRNTRKFEVIEPPNRNRYLLEKFGSA